MTAHSQIATRTPRTVGNVKDRVSQPQRTFIDFTQFGFDQIDWNQYTYTYLNVTFHLAPSLAGLVTTSEALDDAEVFPFGTGPDVMVQRLQEIVGDLMLSQGEVDDPLDDDWLIECLPDAEVTHGLGGVA